MIATDVAVIAQTPLPPSTNPSAITGVQLRAQWRARRVPKRHEASTPSGSATRGCVDRESCAMMSKALNETSSVLFGSQAMIGEAATTIGRATNPAADQTAK
ncbi:MAG TPA: hypothetical protein VNC18_20870 [Gemmatimonadaceae bacterium]|nr:hypothetical protein [Gemmatimonadaceae bacterium]